VQHFGGTDKSWLAIIVALITGLGVRSMVSTAGHPSYLRGALTGLLALAAYYGGTQLYSELATRGFLEKKRPLPPVAATDTEGTAEVEREAEGEAAAEGEGAKTEAEADGVAVPVEPVAPAPPAGTTVVRDPGIPKGLQMQAPSPWDYVWLTVAALIAYELGRGSSTVAPRGPVVPPPDAT
jgi:hypothetical protein